MVKINLSMLKRIKKSLKFFVVAGVVLAGSTLLVGAGSQVVNADPGADKACETLSGFGGEHYYESTKFSGWGRISDYDYLRWL